MSTKSVCSLLRDASRSCRMFFALTFKPPVIFVAMTNFCRRDMSCASHLPIISSVRPSGRATSEGIGYCSAVSIKFTPLSKTARSSMAWHSFSSGALKSALPQRCVPRPISVTEISLLPSLFRRIPFPACSNAPAAPVPARRPEKLKNLLRVSFSDALRRQTRCAGASTPNRTKGLLLEKHHVVEARGCFCHASCPPGLVQAASE
mmetsp:Transcript_7998/g.18593  ORF Transcript_7998/g.18593 Transcript_7998/m.18593 type:complete len:205 (-) Transcript_7998:57-671(-)